MRGVPPGHGLPHRAHASPPTKPEQVTPLDSISAVFNTVVGVAVVIGGREHVRIGLLAAALEQLLREYPLLGGRCVGSSTGVAGRVWVEGRCLCLCGLPSGLCIRTPEAKGCCMNAAAQQQAPICWVCAWDALCRSELDQSSRFVTAAGCFP